jgi:uncharacterized protein with FMN-binding domain
VPVRAAVAIVATIVGVYLLFSFQTPATVPATSRASVVGPTATPTPPAQGGPTPLPPGATPTAAATTTPTATTAGYKDGSYTGQDAPNQYGDVQVKVIISGGKITDVQALTLPTDRQRSAEISQQAGPLLHDEVVQAQSAQIDILSGATFTSDSYAQSVQSALDQAHS